MFRYMDIYCERVDPSFWAEPINALTNIAFFVAAYFAWRTAKARGPVDLWTGILIGVIVAIGTGSFLFHTFAQFWAMLTDVIPITFFIYIYLCLALRRFFKLTSLKTALYFGALVAFDFLVIRQVMPQGEAIAWANGSQDYAFPLFALLLFVPFMLWQRIEGSGLLVLAAAIFLVSLTFRTLDMAVCEAIPIGVHYFWHILNGLLLYVLMVLIIRHGPNTNRA